VIFYLFSQQTRYPRQTRYQLESMWDSQLTLSPIARLGTLTALMNAGYYQLRCGMSSLHENLDSLLVGDTPADP
jgi:hypothetical protein